MQRLREERDNRPLKVVDRYHTLLIEVEPVRGDASGDEIRTRELRCNSFVLAFNFKQNSFTNFDIKVSE